MSIESESATCFLINGSASVTPPGKEMLALVCSFNLLLIPLLLDDLFYYAMRPGDLSSSLLLLSSSILMFLAVKAIVEAFLDDLLYEEKLQLLCAHLACFL